MEDRQIINLLAKKSIESRRNYPVIVTLTPGGRAWHLRLAAGKPGTLRATGATAARGYRPKGTSRPLEAAPSGTTLDRWPVPGQRRLLAPERVAIGMGDPGHERAFDFAFERRRVNRTLTHNARVGRSFRGPGMPDRITWPQRSVFLHTLTPPYLRPSSQLSPHS